MSGAGGVPRERVPAVPEQGWCQGCTPVSRQQLLATSKLWFSAWPTHCTEEPNLLPHPGALSFHPPHAATAAPAASFPLGTAASTTGHLSPGLLTLPSSAAPSGHSV